MNTCHMHARKYSIITILSPSVPGPLALGPWPSAPCLRPSAPGHYWPSAFSTGSLTSGPKSVKLHQARLNSRLGSTRLQGQGATTEPSVSIDHESIQVFRPSPLSVWIIRICSREKECNFLRHQPLYLANALPPRFPHEDVKM